MLTGAQLISFVKANPELSKTELARGAGYVRLADNGKLQILLQTFYAAMMDAHGTPFKNSARLMQGKPVLHETRVHKSGILLVGSVYVKELGASIGDKFSIEILPEGIMLKRHLPVGARPKPQTQAAAGNGIGRKAAAPKPELDDLEDEMYEEEAEEMEYADTAA